MQVLQRLQEAGLKVKPSKCTLAEKQINYLGFSISAKGVCPTYKNVLAVKEFPPLTSQKIFGLSKLLSETLTKHGNHL